MATSRGGFLGFNSIPTPFHRTSYRIQTRTVRRVSAAKQNDFVLESIVHGLNQALSAAAASGIRFQAQSHRSVNFQRLHDAIILLCRQCVHNLMLLLFVVIGVEQNIQCGFHLLHRVILALFHELVHRMDLCVQRRVIPTEELMISNKQWTQQMLFRKD